MAVENPKIASGVENEDSLYPDKDSLTECRRQKLNGINGVRWCNNDAMVKSCGFITNRKLGKYITSKQSAVVFLCARKVQFVKLGQNHGEMPGTPEEMSDGRYT